MELTKILGLRLYGTYENLRLMTFSEMGTWTVWDQLLRNGAQRPVTTYLLGVGNPDPLGVPGLGIEDLGWGRPVLFGDIPRIFL